MSELRQVPPDDPQLLELVTAQQDELSVRYGNTVNHGYAQPPLHPDTIWLLLEVDGDPVGCGAIQPLSHTDPSAAPDLGEVKRLYVAPGHRGQGLSKLLMERLEDAARTAGYVGLQLETGLRQPEALALYRQTGWTEITPYGHYRDSGLSVSFAKTIVG